MKTRDYRTGQTLVMFTLALIPLMGILGLVVDVGWAYFRQEVGQTAADAAATSATSAAYVSAGSAVPTCLTPGVACYATAYSCPPLIISPPTDNIQAGCMYARDNGFVTAGRQTVTFQSGIGSAPGAIGATVGYWVTARTTEQIPQLFSAVLGYPTATVSTQATAGIASSPGSTCIYALSPNAAQALAVTGTSSVTTSQCGVYSNSSSATALLVSGSSHITSTKILVNGGASITGTSTTSPAPTTNAGSIADPLASLPAPAYSGCDQTNYSIGNGNTATLSPGVYCGGISIAGAAGVTVNPGIYVLNGGGLTVSNSARLTGSHVMFYNTGSAGHPIAKVSITGSGVVTLSAPDSGTYQGIAFFQDRALTYAAANTIANSGIGNITGTFYFPTTAFNYTGNTSGVHYSAFIANTIAITGSSSLTNDSAGTYTGLSKTKAVLIQ